MRTRLLAGTTRREVLSSGLLGTLGLVFSPMMQRRIAAAPAGEGGGFKAKRCVVVWLNGGPSHLDTFDPKPGAATGGTFKAIETSAPGIRLSEHLPKLAAQAKHLAFVRSLTSNEADHDRANHLLHTGNLPQETVSFPAMGSLVARRWSSEEAPLPSYVAINGEGPGAGPGFLGLEYAPYVIGDPSAPFENVSPPEGLTERRMARRMLALEAMNRESARRVAPEAIADQVRVSGRARRLMASPALKSLDLSKEPAEILERYGAQGDDGGFGKGCLLARRLLEQGVRFVEVVLDGWDTHEDNFNAIAALSGKLDRGLAALVGDLAERGLLEETLVVCMGEFGRTPIINEKSGRDHWSEAFSAILAGGGIKGGQAFGATDPSGASVEENPVTVPDLFATLLSAFGIDGSKTLNTPEGRPIKLTEKGRVIRSLFG